MVAVLEREASTDFIEAEVCRLAGQIAAATCEFTLLIAELDRREAWKEWGCHSMAHWLSWKCALGVVAAREHVRVGRALETLPLIRGAFSEGRLSYSKARALTRVATPESEAELLEFATIATAAQLDRTVGAYERSAGDGPTEQARLDRTRVRMFDLPNGLVSVNAVLTREQADRLRLAIEEARKEVPRGDDDAPAEARDADALVLVADAFLAGNSDRVPTEVVIHVDAADLGDGELTPVVERALCDTSLRVVGAATAPRRTRTINRALRRRIARRDRRLCRFPGCAHTRFLHVHHLVHYARGGATDEENCVLLCPFHHRLVHEGGWTMTGNGNGTVEFANAHGRRFTDAQEPFPEVRTLPRKRAIDEHTIATAFGEPMRLVDGVDALVAWLNQRVALIRGRGGGRGDVRR